MGKFKNSLILLMVLGSWAAWAVDSHVVSAGGGKEIDEHGTCKLIENTNSEAIMVPTKTSAEWLSFVAHLPTNVSSSACVPPDICAGTPTIGSTCVGGALYMGQFDGGKYMVTPSGCTDSANPTCAGGTDTVTKSWNNGSSNWYDIPGVESFPIFSQKSSSSYRGNVNTAAIVLITASGQGGIHQAAKYCDDMSYGGYTDWYLPSKSEIAYMYCKSSAPSHNTSYPQEEANCVGYGGKTSNLGGFVSNSYWSSTEYSSYVSWIQNFNNGYQDPNNKTNARYVRCVRRY